MAKIGSIHPRAQQSIPSNGASYSRKVLVLGGGATATRIAEELADEGFQCYFSAGPGGLEGPNGAEKPEREAGRKRPGSELPTLRDVNGLQKLRAIFESFVQKHSEHGRGLCYIHPGASVWGERPELMTLGQEVGAHVIGPSARILSLFANKLNFLAQAEKLEIPHLLLCPDPMHTLREIEQRRFSFPIVLKAVKGGLTAGHYVVHDFEELRTGFSLWMEQVRTHCGEVIVLVEKYLEGARHLVLPFVRFSDGRFETFPVVDASLQCRHRKMIEFCPAHGLDVQVLQLIQQWAQSLASSMDYVGVGTFEFLVEGVRPFLIGGSARLNKSFRLWEEVAGTRAVAWQLAAFEGYSETQCQSLREKMPEPKWTCAGEIRLFAEDPVLQLPQPGFVQEVSDKKFWSFPAAEAVLDLAVEEKRSISPFSSGLVGVLRVGAQDPRQLTTVARGVLDEIWVAGSLQTNERFVAELLEHPWVNEGIFHAGFIDEEFLPAIRPPQDLLPIFATACAQIPESLESSEESSETSPGRWAVGDQWVKPDPQGLRWVEGPHFWKRSDEDTRAMTQSLGMSGVLEAKTGRKVRICAFPIAEKRWQVRVSNWNLVVRKVSLNSAQKAKPRILALAPGRVHSLLFQEGAVAPAHEPLLMIESLGMLVPHAAPLDLRIRRWKVAAEDLVRAGDELVDFEVQGKV